MTPSRPPGWRAGGWWTGARRVESPHRNPRPRGAGIELVVVHSISLPPGRYGSDAIERLFTQRIDCDAHPYYERLRGVRVSSHFLVRRDGELVQFVGCDERAWHAGESRWQERDNCNDFSIGVELEGLEGLLFDDRQYPALADLLAALRERYPISGIAGHEHVAVGRKHDPGRGFDWTRLRSDTGWPDRYFPRAVA